MNRPECVGWVGRLLGHKMRPRFSEARMFPQALGTWTTLRIRAPETVMDYTRTYHGDVCERCGWTRDKEAA